VDRSLRRRGQFLVLGCALAGALIGVALGLLVEDGQAPAAVAAPGRQGGGAVAAVTTPASSPPGAAQATSAGPAAAGDEPPGERRSRSADHAGKREKKAEGGDTKPGDRGKGKPAKAKGKRK
jgi:hypothetical protein